MDTILFQFCSNWSNPLVLLDLFLVLLAVLLMLINPPPPHILTIRLKRILIGLGVVVTVMWLTFTILANNRLAPASWFQTLTKPEKLVMKEYSEYTHKPINMLKFIELQHRYERYTTSKEAANMQLGLLNRP